MKARNGGLHTAVCVLGLLLYHPLLAGQKPAVGAPSDSSTQAWPQWGGPNRDFKVSAHGLATSWPANGPRKLWSRSLGEGYSAIVVDAGRLFTMYRKPASFWQIGTRDQEVVIALDASTGKTLWEFNYDAPLLKGMDAERGPGPHSTPLVSGDLLFTVGVTGKFHCLNKNDGKLLWSHDLWGKFQGTFIDTGYSSSPIAYKDLVILPVGGPGRAVMAFRQKDGTVAWSKQDFTNSPSSPILASVDGQDQLIAFLAAEVVGLDPNNGELLWRYPHATRWNLNISTPVWGDGNLVFISSAYDVGSRVLQLVRNGKKTEAKQLWYNRRVRVHKDNAVVVGDYVYCSSGDFGPAFFTAVNLKTGEVRWQDRTFSKASFVYADGRFIVLDEDGNLGMAEARPEGLKVLAKVELMTSNSWTVPTLVGTRLFVRDRKTILALDLS